MRYTYKSKDKALKKLALLSKERTYLIEDEGVTPAEEWLLEKIHSFKDNKKAYWHPHYSRKQKRGLIHLARAIGIYPVPEWWTVREKLKDSLKPKKEESLWWTADLSRQYIQTIFLLEVRKITQ